MAMLVYRRVSISAVSIRKTNMLSPENFIRKKEIPNLKTHHGLQVQPLNLPGGKHQSGKKIDETEVFHSIKN